MYTKKEYYMQSVNLYGQNYNNKINFKGYASYDNVLMTDRGKISRKTAKLMAAINNCIDLEWEKIKKQKIRDNIPTYTCKDGKSSVFIKPVYSQRYPALLVEHDNGKIKQNILLDRSNPNNFRYEKTIVTDHGSATLKSYDSRVSNDNEINNFVDKLLQKSFEEITTTKLLRQYFDDDEFIRKGGSIVLG